MVRPSVFPVGPPRWGRLGGTVQVGPLRWWDRRGRPPSLESAAICLKDEESREPRLGWSVGATRSEAGRVMPARCKLIWILVVVLTMNKRLG